MHHESPEEYVSFDLPRAPVDPPVGVELELGAGTASQVDNPEVSFTCKDCGKKYGRAKQLYEHMRIVSIKLK